MELRHLRYFLAVAEELNFTKAAERLSMSQPPLSMQIRDLEEELGVQLFHRTKRRVRLTTAGEVFLAETREILSRSVRAAERARQANRGESGVLRVGFLTSTTGSRLSETLRRYCAQSPDVELELSDLTPREMAVGLTQSRLDVAITRPCPLMEGFAQRPLYQDRLLLALPTDHPLAAEETISLEDLGDERLITLTEDESPEFNAMVRRLVEPYTPNFENRLETKSISTILWMVSLGLGISFLTEEISGMRWEGSVYRALSEDVPLLTTVLAWKDDDPSPTLARFLTYF